MMMHLKKYLNFFLLFSTILVSSQEELYTSLTIPAHLTSNANAVVRLDDVGIVLESSKDMNIKHKRIITVLNKEGNDDVNALVYYDNDRKVKKLQAVIFDAYGNELNKFKKNDFKDVSAVDGGTLYSDSRVMYLDFTPINYPYTVEFTCEVSTENTAFIPSFVPIDGFFVAVEKSVYSVGFPEHVSIRTKENNFENLNLEKTETIGGIEYQIKNLEAIKPEDYSPPFQSFMPRAMLAVNQFNYEGVFAQVDDWAGMGKWFHDNLLVGRTAISQETKREIDKLVSGIDDPIKRAEIVYEFVQNNTRYISVQVGIGGMQPIAALDVDNVKYGDCKGLSNYTKALLDYVGVKSYYTRLYASSKNQISVDKDFVSFGGQTNHVILNIPQEEADDIWLECTSQDLPFGFIGDFTDNRDVLVIKPEGGEIKHTKKYETEENVQHVNGNYSVSNEGVIEAHVEIISQGLQYDQKYRLELETSRDLDSYYKDRWGYVNNIFISNMKFNNDKQAVEFLEEIDFKATNYPKIVGDRMLLSLNVFNRSDDIPDRYRNRKLPVQIVRGFKDVDRVEITLPSNYRVEVLPGKKEIQNKFGSYHYEVTEKDKNTLIYTREFVLRDGKFPREDYTAFRNFLKEVSKLDHIKVALIKNQL
ncbi:DUF3857 domain-containing protein [Gaetbulibacter saemankumensis]|uniref:DUF3857 domain-containing protein n=1 Tax=Gaetbulibacter saemankumensis TaxID=311208 RepID=UPI00041F898A|nr:DUF3857 domain-containing protein [Gaetbulibacter saemankumensis]